MLSIHEDVKTTPNRLKQIAIENIVIEDRESGKKFELEAFECYDVRF